MLTEFTGIGNLGQSPKLQNQGVDGGMLFKEVVS
jgi:hypothetical protein